MSSDFISGLSLGLFFTAYSGFCIFGRKWLHAYSVRQNGKVLAQLQRNPRPAQITMCLFGVLLVCFGIAESIFDKAAIAKDGLWPALFIMSMGILCLTWAKYVVLLQKISYRITLNPLTAWAGNVAMILMASIMGILGVYALAGLFFTK